MEKAIRPKKRWFAQGRLPHFKMRSCALVTGYKEMPCEMGLAVSLATKRDLEKMLEMCEHGTRGINTNIYKYS